MKRRTVGLQDGNRGLGRQKTALEDATELRERGRGLRQQGEGRALRWVGRGRLRREAGQGRAKRPERVRGTGGAGPGGPQHAAAPCRGSAAARGGAAGSAAKQGAGRERGPAENRDRRQETGRG